MGFFDPKKETEIVSEETEQEVNVSGFKRPYACWKVGDKTYKMKLTTSKILELEGKYKTNLLNIMGTNDGGMPALTVMLDIAYAAMSKYHGAITRAQVKDIFSDYIEEGGSQLKFYMNVYMDIFRVSGFFTEDQNEKLGKTMQEIQAETQTEE